MVEMYYMSACRRIRSLCNFIALMDIKNLQASSSLTFHFHHKQPWCAALVPLRISPLSL